MHSTYTFHYKRLLYFDTKLTRSNIEQRKVLSGSLTRILTRLVGIQTSIKTIPTNDDFRVKRVNFLKFTILCTFLINFHLI